MNKLILAILTVVFASSAHATSGDMFNVRINPLGLFVGAYGVMVDFKIASDWTIGPDIEYLNYSESSNSSYFSQRFQENAYGFGARANWFYNGALTTGLYVGPSLNYFNVSVTTKDLNGNSITGSTSGAYLGCLVGYAWFWEHFNIMLGGGAVVGLGDNQIKISDSYGDQTVAANISGLALEFSLGWTF